MEEEELEDEDKKEGVKGMLEGFLTVSLQKSTCHRGRKSEYSSNDIFCALYCCEIDVHNYDCSLWPLRTAKLPKTSTRQ